MVAEKIVGIARKNEISVAILLSIPINKPPIMVAPDLETPGIMAKDCIIPNNIEFLIFIFSILLNLLLVLNFSINKKAIPPIINEMAITFSEKK